MTTTHHPPTSGPARCPICERPPAPDLRPFCSRRCADVDLTRWFGGAYRVQTDEPPLPGTED